MLLCWIWRGLKISLMTVKKETGNTNERHLKNWVPFVFEGKYCGENSPTVQ